MNATGIYEIVNLVNGKRYIGSAVNFKKRWNSHQHSLRQGKHPSKHLQSTWNKHGAERFSFRPLILCDRDNLLMYEQIAIDAMKPEYNKCPTAGSCIGRKATAETLAKMSARASSISPETRARMSEAQSKRRHSEETKLKLSLHFKGRKVSDETRAKLSAAAKGHAVSDETRQKLRDALVGKEVRRGWSHTPESRAKMSAAKLGKPLGKRSSK